MKRSMMISAFSLLLAVGTPALAKDFAVPGTKLTAYIPDGWKMSAAGDELLIASEYTRWYVRYESEYPNLVPDREVISEGFYVMAAYHVTPWFTPGVYYSARYPNVDDRHGRDAFQHDAAITFRYDVNEHWLFKLESHYMYGTAGLRDELNDGKEPSELTKEWGVFLAKTTAYF